MDATSASAWFKENTTPSNDFNAAKLSFINNDFMSENAAKDHALAYILRNSGIILLKAPKGSTDFKKIGADKGATLDDAGKAIFVKQDCN